MDGSQLLTDRTHLNGKSVSGVSDSKMKDVFQKHSATASKKGPMAKKYEDDQRIAEMSKTSKKSSIAKQSESGTNV